MFLFARVGDRGILVVHVILLHNCKPIEHCKRNKNTKNFILYINVNLTEYVFKKKWNLSCVVKKTFFNWPDPLTFDP